MMVFEPGRIKTMRLPNRFVRSATYDGLSDASGAVTDRQIELISALAQGGVGLIVSAIMYVHPSGQVSAFMNSIADGADMGGLKKLVRAAHSGGAKNAVQLYHGGREARFVKTRKQLPLAPSVVADDPYYRGGYREMTADEIATVIDAFGQAAQRAREVGFDALQIHGAHGYLFSQFLSPFTNRRNDCWGGSLENRLRLHRDVFAAMRKQTGEDYPLLIKLGVEDGFEGGLSLAEGVKAAKMLAETGYDALEISSGVRGNAYEGTEYKTRIQKPARQGYFLTWAREIKKRVGVPVIAVGGFRSMGMMEGAIAKGEADFVSLCRPLIAEPDIINHWRRDPEKKPKCVSCNKCLEELHRGAPLRCVVLAGQE